jgi:hypothetical protein
MFEQTILKFLAFLTRYVLRLPSPSFITIYEVGENSECVYNTGLPQQVFLF